MEALAYHEAVPGHHLQIAIAQELDELPDFRQHEGFTVFVEGWGLYSESLPVEVGLYKDPYSRFGRLTFDAWRASRLVVDMGIHALRWERQQAIDFLKERTALSEHDIISEIDRYIAWPGQALAYKIGELKIRELRRYAEDRLGERFDVREFHDTLLQNGSIPLDVLESEIDNWLAGS
jgi:prolyl oligopeptidase